MLWRWQEFLCSRNSKNQILVSRSHLPCSISWNRGVLGRIWFMTLVVVDTTLNSNYTMTHLWTFAKKIGMLNHLLTQCEILFLWYYATGILKMCFSLKGVYMGEYAMNVVIWNCSIGSFLSIQHTLDCQISQLSGRDMSMSPWIHHVLHMFHIRESTCSRMIFIF